MDPPNTTIPVCELIGLSHKKDGRTKKQSRAQGIELRDSNRSKDIAIEKRFNTITTDKPEINSKSQVTCMREKSDMDNVDSIGQNLFLFPSDTPQKVDKFPQINNENTRNETVKNDTVIKYDSTAQNATQETDNEHTQIGNIDVAVSDKDSQPSSYVVNDSSSSYTNVPTNKASRQNINGDGMEPNLNSSCDTTASMFNDDETKNEAFSTVVSKRLDALKNNETNTQAARGIRSQPIDDSEVSLVDLHDLVPQKTDRMDSDIKIAKDIKTNAKADHAQSSCLKHSIRITWQRHGNMYSFEKLEKSEKDSSLERKKIDSNKALQLELFPSTRTIINDILSLKTGSKCTDLFHTSDLERHWVEIELRPVEFTRDLFESALMGLCHYANLPEFQIKRIIQLLRELLDMIESRLTALHSTPIVQPECTEPLSHNMTEAGALAAGHTPNPIEESRALVNRFVRLNARPYEQAYQAASQVQDNETMIDRSRWFYKEIVRLIEKLAQLQNQIQHESSDDQVGRFAIG